MCGSLVRVLYELLCVFVLKGTEHVFYPTSEARLKGASLRLSKSLCGKERRLDLKKDPRSLWRFLGVGICLPTDPGKGRPKGVRRCGCCGPCAIVSVRSTCVRTDERYTWLPTGTGDTHWKDRSGMRHVVAPSCVGGTRVPVRGLRSEWTYTCESSVSVEVKR